MGSTPEWLKKRRSSMATKAFDADDLDRGRALGNFERLNRRQRRDGEGDGADRRDQRPQAEHQGPIEKPPQRRRGAAFALASCGPLTGRAVRRFCRRSGGGARAAWLAPPRRHRFASRIAPRGKLMAVI